MPAMDCMLCNSRRKNLHLHVEHHARKDGMKENVFYPLRHVWCIFDPYDKREKGSEAGMWDNRSVESGRGNTHLKVAFVLLRKKCLAEGNCFGTASCASPPNYERRDTSVGEWMKQKE